MKKYILILISFFAFTNTTIAKNKIHKDYQGKECLPPPKSNTLQYDGIACLQDSLDSLIAISKGNKTAIIDKHGVYITPFIYDRKTSFYFDQGLTTVKKGNKYGFIDIRGKAVIPFVYDNVISFTSNLNLAAVKQNGKWGFIDNTGKLIIPFKYERVKDCSFKVSFNSKQPRLAGVRVNGKWGFIDTKGNTIIPFDYDSIGTCPFRGDLGRGDVNAINRDLAVIEKYGKLGLVNRSGKIVAPFDYDQIDLKDDFPHVKRQGKWRVIVK